MSIKLSILFVAIAVLSSVCFASQPQSMQISRQPRLSPSPSAADRQLRRKCNREIQFCTRQNIDVFGLFVQTVLSIDLTRVNNDEAHQITENLCITFRPIFDCVDRRNASWCSVPIGQQANKLFHISYFVLVCELTKIWRECSVVGNSIETGAQSSQVTSVCSDHFPALNREAEQLRLLTNPFGSSIPKTAATPEMSMMADQQPIVAPSTVASMEFILLNITESHCEEIMLFAGCQLHWTRSICGKKAYEIVRRLFSAYNDMSGKKCSGNHELQEVDFEVLERKYAERYLYLPSSSATLESEPTKSISDNEEATPAPVDVNQPSPGAPPATREAGDSILDDQISNVGEKLLPPLAKKSPASPPATGPLNSSEKIRHFNYLHIFAILLTIVILRKSTF